MYNNYVYIFVSAAVSLIIRVIPMTVLRKKIKNKFFLSFLHYVPYVTLAVMTFPAIIDATQTPVAGIIALIAGVLLAFSGANMFTVAFVCCVVTFISEAIIFNIL